MRKIISVVLLLLAAHVAEAQDVLTKKQDGTYVVNTTTLATDVEGYAGPTPVEVHLRKNKIVKVVALKNQESPRHNARIKRDMLPRYEGQKVSKKQQPKVDAVTGSTFTSKAMQENVRRAIDYYLRHK